MHRSIRAGWVGVAAFLFGAAFSHPAQSQALFRATLTPEQQTGEVTSGGSGTAIAALEATELRFAITVDGLSGPITGAHFHAGPMGTNGGVVRTITSSFDGQTAAGVWLESDGEPLTPELRGALLAGNLYVNIHTAAYPAGEIRGQLLLDVGTLLTSRLTPYQQTGDVTSDGSGTAAVWLLGTTAVFHLTVDGLSGPITGAHFHRARAGVAGGVVRTITDAFNGGTAFGVWFPGDAQPMTPDLLEAFATGELYLNVHTAAYPAGEIRGQVVPSVGWGFTAALDAGQQTGNVISDARGTAHATFNGAGISWSVTVEGLSSDITAAHFHLGGAGENGLPVRTITSKFVGGTAMGLWGFDGDEALTAELVAAALAGNIYLNVHTVNYPGGEIRGQLQLQTSTPMRADLSSAQEVHEVAQDASGTAALHLTDSGVEFQVSVEGLSGPITGAHFHAAPPGQNGGVVRTITTDFSQGTATGFWTASDDEPLTEALVASLLSGHLYLNVHTAANPAGEIRGQVYPTGGTGLQASLTPAQETHDVTSGATGTATLVHTPFGVAYSMTATGLSGPPTGAHFHSGEIGVNGGVVRGITDDFAGGTAVGVWTATDAQPLTEELEAGLLTGGLYLNVHTAAYGAGELRGQVTPRGIIGLIAQLDSDQEGHDVVSAARGTAAVTMSTASARYDLTVEGLTGPITAAHFHLAPAGFDGTPVRTITGDFTGNTAGGVWLPTNPERLTPELLYALATEGIYLNVHTTAYPAGEIRGQIVEPNIDIGVGVERLEDGDTPSRFRLHESYPNPFNPATTIGFMLDRAGHTTLEVFDVLGRRMATLADGPLGAGEYRVRFDAAGLPSGVYMYVLRQGAKREARTMTLLR